MEIQERVVDGEWKTYELKNDHGMTATVTNLGATLTDLRVPDKNGLIESVILAHENLKEYKENPHFLGATIGRVAGRIKDSTIQLEGQTYELEKNEGRHHLHGGAKGFHTKFWDSETFQKEDSCGVTFSLEVPHLEDGYPGHVQVSVTYTLSSVQTLSVTYEAETDRMTPLTLTNHTYFNLSGDLHRTVHDHVFQLDSDQFLEMDDGLIPTGKKASVEGSPFDFREPAPLSVGFSNEHSQNKIARAGFDHYFLFKETRQAVLKEPQSGRLMTVDTDQPGLVLYTSTNLTKGFPLRNRESEKYLGVCLETQASPASLHHSDLPDLLTTPERPYRSTTTFSFSIEK